MSGLQRHARSAACAPDVVQPAAGDRPKTILFVMKQLGLVRYYQPTLRILAERGHKVYVAHSTSPTAAANIYGERLVLAAPEIKILRAAEREPGPWTAFAWAVRLLFDYVRYFDSRFARATILRVRVEDKYIPRWGQLALKPLRLLGDRGVRTAIALLRQVEEAIPVSAPAQKSLQELRPDVVLVTPLVDWGSPLVDYVRAGQAAGIPTGLCVASWDNLTNKGHMRVVPDRVFVWNAPQKNEAVSFHDVPPSNVVVTGAQLFDHLFELQPAHDRDEFCRTVGLDPARPFVVFVGSTTWIAPQELYFVERWIRHLRQAEDPRVASLGIMIRPHPSAARRYLSMDVSPLENVCIWPPPATTVSAEYFSTAGQHELVEVIHHSAAVVGANTSAQIDAGIVGRPVCTLRVPEFIHSQEGTLHFAHLANNDRALLRIAEDLDGHVRDLAEILSGKGSDHERALAFVREFVRPRGLDVPAAPILADEIEAAAELSVEPHAVGGGVRVLRAFLYPLARLAGRHRTGTGGPLWVRLVRPLINIWVRVVVLRISLSPTRLRRLQARVARRVRRGLSLTSRRGRRMVARSLRVARRLRCARRRVRVRAQRLASRTAPRVPVGLDSDTEVREAEEREPARVGNIRSADCSNYNLESCKDASPISPARRR